MSRGAGFTSLRWRVLNWFGPVEIGWLIVLAYVVMTLDRFPGNSLVPGGAALALLTAVALPLPNVLTTRVPRTRSVFFAGAVWLLLVAWMLASAYWSTAGLLTLKRAVLVCIPVSVLFILVWGQFRDVTLSVTFLRALTLIAFGLAAVGIIVLVFGRIEMSAEGRIQRLGIGFVDVGQRLDGTPPWIRITSLMENPNGLGAMLAVGVNAAFALRTRIVRKSVLWILCVVQIVGLGLTLSRSAAGLAFTGILMQLVLRRRRTSGRIGMVMVMLVAALGVTMLVWFAAVRDSAGGAGTDRLDLALTGREDAWRPLIESISRSPVLGRGFGVVDEEILYKAGVEIGAHNAHLMLLGEIGAIGYGLALVIWIGGILHAVTVSARETGDGRLTRIMACALATALLFQQVFEAGVLRFSLSGLVWALVVAECWRPPIRLCDSREGPGRATPESEASTPTLARGTRR